MAENCFLLFARATVQKGRLDRIIMRYGEANEKNETDFGFDINMLLSQVEIKAKHALEKSKRNHLSS